MEITAPSFGQGREKFSTVKIRQYLLLLKEIIIVFLNRIKSLGFSDAMEEYDQRKLSIFNLLNFFQLLTGILIPVIGLFNNKQLPAGSWVVACSPALVSLLVLYLNKKQKHEFAIVTYILLYPFITCIVYMYGMNLGIGLYFILYGILSVFYLKDTGLMIFSLCFSMVSYFLLAVVIKHYVYEMQSMNHGLYLFNQGIAILFIFYGLFLIKKENTGYHSRILSKNAALHEKIQ